MDRNLWKKNAYNALLRRLTLSDYYERDGYENSAEEYLVAVYGITQTGKTSTILRMINIREECFDEVSELLKAGRKEGNSSTSTAIIYSMSEDDEKFGVAYADISEMDPGKPEFLDGPQMKSRLENIRKSIEEQPSTYMGRLNIMIPKKYFRNDDGYSSSIRIIDLPGIGSKEEREQEHVNSIVEYYMKLAPMCIIVCRAGNIRTLKTIGDPNEGLRGLGRWWEYPDLYSVVITHAYSENSVYKKILKETPEMPSLSEYVTEIYKEELADDEMFGEDFNVNVFPIDVGNSYNTLLEKLDKHDPAIKDNVKNAVSDTVGSLKKQIETSRNGDRLLPALKDLSERIEEENRKADEDIAGKIDAKDKRCVSINNLIKNNDKEIERAKKKIKDEKTHIDEIYSIISEKLSDGINYFDKDKIVKEVIEDTSLCKNDRLKHKKRIKERLDEITNKNIDDFYTFCNIISKNDCGDPELQIELNKAVNSLKFDVRKEISKFDFDEEFDKYSKGFHRLKSKDFANICSGFQEYANGVCKKYIDEHFKVIFCRAVSKAYKRIEAQNKISRKAEDYNRENEIQLNVEKKERAGLEREREELVKKQKHNREIFEKRMSYVENEYKKQHNEMVRKINRSNSAEERLVTLMNLALLEDDYSKFKGGNI